MKRTDLIALAERIKRIRQSVEEPCPNCWDAEFPGSKRGMRCEVCSGSGRVENPDFDPAVKNDAIDIILQIAQAQPVAWQLVRSRDGFVRGTYESEPTALQLEIAGLENEEYRALYTLPLED